jgi:hypothetical protein
MLIHDFVNKCSGYDNWLCYAKAMVTERLAPDKRVCAVTPVMSHQNARVAKD